jgi:hypothetical protein
MKLMKDSAGASDYQLTIKVTVRGSIKLNYLKYFSIV